MMINYGHVSKLLHVTRNYLTDVANNTLIHLAPYAFIYAVGAGFILAINVDSHCISTEPSFLIH